MALCSLQFENLTSQDFLQNKTSLTWQRQTPWSKLQRIRLTDEECINPTDMEYRPHTQVVWSNRSFLSPLLLGWELCLWVVHQNTQDGHQWARHLWWLVSALEVPEVETLVCEYMCECSCNQFVGVKISNKKKHVWRAIIMLQSCFDFPSRISK
jgi:hypothetical protein